MLEHKHGFKRRQIEAEKEASVQVQSTKTDRKTFRLKIIDAENQNFLVLFSWASQVGGTL